LDFLDFILKNLKNIKTYFCQPCTVCCHSRSAMHLSTSSLCNWSLTSICLNSFCEGRDGTIVLRANLQRMNSPGGKSAKHNCPVNGPTICTPPPESSWKCDLNVTYFTFYWVASPPESSFVRNSYIYTYVTWHVRDYTITSPSSFGDVIHLGSVNCCTLLASLSSILIKCRRPVSCLHRPKYGNDPSRGVQRIHQLICTNGFRTSRIYHAHER